MSGLVAFSTHNLKVVVITDRTDSLSYGLIHLWVFLTCYIEIALNTSHSHSDFSFPLHPSSPLLLCHLSHSIFMSASFSLVIAVAAEASGVVPVGCLEATHDTVALRLARVSSSVRRSVVIRFK